MAFGMKDVLNSAKTMAGAGGSSLLQGGLNNYSEVSAEQLMQEYLSLIHILSRPEIPLPYMHQIQGSRYTSGFPDNCSKCPSAARAHRQC